MPPIEGERASGSGLIGNVMLERRGGPPRVKFEKPLEAWIVAVDDAYIGECKVVELSAAVRS